MLFINEEIMIHNVYISTNFLTLKKKLKTESHKND